jgi:predicted ABC-type exoprotein transport system permease subunit
VRSTTNRDVDDDLIDLILRLIILQHLGHVWIASNLPVVQLCMFFCFLCECALMWFSCAQDESLMKKVVDAISIRSVVALASVNNASMGFFFLITILFITKRFSIYEFHCG